MSRNFSTWIRSKAGIATIVGVVVVVLLLAVVGQQLGWYGGPGAAMAVSPNPATCGVVPTTYNVENPATIPFYSIKFVWSGGQPVKSGAADNFAFTLPTAAAQSLTTVRTYATAGSYQSEVTLDGCNFAGTRACTLVLDPTKRFYFQFKGAKDNGNGTLTLNFYVRVMVSDPLVSTAIQLPDGVVASSPTGTYTGSTCPTP